MDKVVTRKIIQSVRIELGGLVQGVGFRPWVKQQAVKRNLNGKVYNNSNGVTIEVSGCLKDIKSFKREIQTSSPGEIVKFSLKPVDCLYQNGFNILESKYTTSQIIPIIPDQGICSKCINELYDKNNRRYQYPFITCASCGPRFSILEKIPYDRNNTTMVEFPMCGQCELEYSDINNRRFHAQIISCQNCGPSLYLLSSSGNNIDIKSDCIKYLCDLIKNGKIVIIKGVGGYHLVCDATNDSAVVNLRKLKNRISKPFAVMFPDIKSIKDNCRVSAIEKEILSNNKAPIVLLEKIKNNNKSNLNKLSLFLAPHLNQLGAFLPYTGLQHLLLREADRPLVMTSCNLPGRPICYELSDVVNQFENKVDAILTDNRRITLPSDDSVVRVVNNQVQVIRRARGYSLNLNFKTNDDHNDSPCISYGAQMKTTIAFSVNNNIIVSPYIGDLHSLDYIKRLELYEEKICQILNVKPTHINIDRHPGFSVRDHLEHKNIDRELILKSVQHHEAHAYAALSEYSDIKKAAVFVWDGTGLGNNNEIWGGEVFRWSNRKLERHYSFKKFKLIGFDAAIKEPKRVALAILLQKHGKDLPKYWQTWIDENFSRKDYANLVKLYSNNTRCVYCTSVGRLFDAVASLLDMVQINDYDGHAPAVLESLACKAVNKDLGLACNLNLSIVNNAGFNEIDWLPLINHIEILLEYNYSVADIAYNFHKNLASIIVKISKLMGESNIILTGGVFQNKLLVELVVAMAKQYEIAVIVPTELPINDGGISVGQLYA